MIIHRKTMDAKKVLLKILKLKIQFLQLLRETDPWFFSFSVLGRNYETPQIEQTQLSHWG